MTLKHLLPLLACISCLAERSHERDPRLATEITRQERWAQDSVGGRATPEDLEKIRSGDQETVNLGRKQLRKLTSSVDRGTWIREAAVESLREDGDEPALVDDFEKAGQTRTEALQAADDLALALSETRGGVTLPDLRKALESSRRARNSEAKLAKELGAASQPIARGDVPNNPGKTPAAATAPAGKALAVNPLAKLSTVALPVPKPFIAATARYLFEHPDEKLTGFAGDDATEIRAQLADLTAHPPPAIKPSRSSESRVETAAPPDAGSASSPAGEAAAASSVPTDAEMGEDESRASPGLGLSDSEPRRERAGTSAMLTIAKDAQKLVARRGPPRSFATRADGLFALRYQETRSCGVDRCVSDVDYLFDASGKLVREEATPKR